MKTVRLAGIFDDVFNPTQADLEAIHTYVVGLKSKNPTPAASTLITLFEKWYASLGVTDWFLDVDTLQEARRRRDAIDEANNAKRDYSTSAAGYIPGVGKIEGSAPGGGLAAGLRHATGTETGGDPEPGPDLGLGLKIGAGVLAVALVTLLILSRKV